MTRRGLLGALLGAATMDPERLLWVPGQRVYSIPKPVVEKFPTYQEWSRLYDGQHIFYVRMELGVTKTKFRPTGEIPSGNWKVIEA
jgi:hypothetical protein